MVVLCCVQTLQDGLNTLLYLVNSVTAFLKLNDQTDLKGVMAGRQ